MTSPRLSPKKRKFKCPMSSLQQFLTNLNAPWSSLKPLRFQKSNWKRRLLLKKTKSIKPRTLKNLKSVLGIPLFPQLKLKRSQRLPLRSLNLWSPNSSVLTAQRPLPKSAPSVGIPPRPTLESPKITLGRCWSD